MNERVIEKLIEEYEARLEWYKRFLELYPKLIRSGFIAIFTIPILFMILMFSVESKLIFLVLWIISIIAIAGYLITVEYIYYHYKEKFGEFDALTQDGEDIIEGGGTDEDNMEDL